jgi:hypothetical protein
MFADSDEHSTGPIHRTAVVQNYYFPSFRLYAAGPCVRLADLIDSDYFSDPGIRTEVEHCDRLDFRAAESEKYFAEAGNCDYPDLYATESGAHCPDRTDSESGRHDYPASFDDRSAGCRNDLRVLWCEARCLPAGLCCSPWELQL